MIQKTNSTMKIQFRHTRVFTFLLTLLLLCGGTNQAWAQTEVTYHILALPMNHATGTKNTNASYDGFRVEAVKVVAQSSTIVLPDHFKSPLAKNFTYYAADFVTKGSIVAIYPNQANTKYQLYTAPIAPYIKVTKSGGSVTEEASTAAAWTAHSDGSQNTATNATDYSTQKGALADGTHYFKMTTLNEGAPIGTHTEIYVTYEYDPDNTIAKLDGSVAYNISMFTGTDASKKGFLALNRGRNNRLTIVPASKVSSSDLISDDFVKIDVSDTDMKTYWQSGDNWNDKNVVASNFHFLFRYIGEDPYNITICTDYHLDKYYIEKFANDIGQVNKYYKGSTVYYAPSTSNPELFITSDVDVKYTTKSTSKSSLASGVTSEAKPGWYRQLAAPIWNSFAILDVKYIDPSKTGHVFLATRTHNANGTFNGPTKDNKNNYQYNYIQAERNVMKIVAQTPSTAVSKYTVDDEIYELEDVNFKVKTQFGNEITAPIQLSKYSIEHEEIRVEDIPSALDRKYINYTGKFYKDAALENEITSYLDAYDEGTEKYNVYVGYEVSNTAPFKTIKPTDSYTTATWYELTDKDATTDKKIKWDGSSNFKNNGATTTYDKLSEFAFVGDPYEMQVLYRKGTEDATAKFCVGGSLGISRTADIVYGTNYVFSEPSAAQTMTFHVSGFAATSGNKYTVTIGGTGSGQVTSTTPSTATDLSSSSADVTVTIAACSTPSKTFTITIQETESDGTTPVGTPTVVTVNQSDKDYTWEIPYDATEGSFLLRKFSDTGHWYWDTSASDQDITYSTANETRLKVLELPKRNFTYNIVDKAGKIAVKATVSQTIFSQLNGYASIPEVIRSPFLADETVTFYSAFDNGSGAGTGTSRKDLSSSITELSEGAPASSTDIYVKYTTAKLDEKSIKLHADNINQQFNVKINGSYIYYDSDSGKIKSNSSATTDLLATDPYLWYLRNRDPYAMLIDNIEARTALTVTGTEPVTMYDDNGNEITPTPTKDKGAWVKVDGGTWGDDKAIVFTSTRDEASHFIAMMSNNSGVYEVLAATGDETYYHIGRTTDTKIYSVSTTDYAHGDPALRFELAGKEAIFYHLIDKAGTDLFGEEIYSNNPRLALPAAYVSPLVEEYYYYPTSAKAATNLEGDRISEIDNDTNESGVGGESKDRHVYVTYKVNDLVKFNDDKNPYMLRFHNGGNYIMEDGSDKLTDEPIKAVYPYTNGDGNLNIYGDDMQKEQFNGGSNTRSRWTWFFDSSNNDPYHVVIRSNNTISYNNARQATYLQTYAVNFKQDAATHIVTGGVMAGAASVPPTEYMILGTRGSYKLTTTEKIEGARREVRSLEQYWKTYNVVKLYVLGVDPSTDAFSNDELTWVVPTEPASYRTTLTTTKGWHSYDAIAYATRWNGYNDKSDGHEKKVVEKVEHWYQTFDMGDGTFDIESANIPPVLILLDRHGWEIMRKPLPKYEAYPYGDELADLKVYDSPMVKEYKFYSNASKATGCHKYSLRMQNDAERDQIKVGGKHYTSTSLAALPPRTATGVISGEAIQDQYVTYTVKEEYENSYKYHLELHEEDSTYTESGTPSKFLILQNGRYARKVENDDKVTSYLSKPIIEATEPTGGNVYDMILSPSRTDYPQGYLAPDKNGDGIIDDLHLWYIQPNLNIDKEMGIKWANKGGGGGEPFTEYETKKKYKEKAGFDPYNIQLKNASSNKYLTSHMTTTRLSGGVMVGVYTGDGGNTNITLETWVDVKNADTGTSTGSVGYDKSNIVMTNQTFMAVSDANGNMQLMPRFDHSMRMNVDASSHNTTLESPVNHAKASVDNNVSMGPQTTFFVRPQVIEYHILDNDGQEALRYKRAGEDFPSITDHFKSPLATDFKFYFNHAASTTSASNRESHTAAGTSDYFKKTVDSESEMTTAANALTVLDDYYFRIGTSAPYDYKKVTVTKAHSGTTNATYTTTDCKQADWENAVASQSSAADEAAMQTAILGLAKGTYYYQIGPADHYAYKKVHRADGKNTITISDASTYDGATNKNTAADGKDLDEKAKELVSDGDYYYKVGPLYNYQKVVVSGSNETLSTDIAAGKDISDREITGSFADADLTGMTNNVYVRYSYDASSDDQGILQGKWFTVKLANKDVLASGVVEAFTRMVTSIDEINDDVAKLTVTGDYFYRIGASSPYAYKKVNVTSITATPVENTHYTVTNSDEEEWTNTLGLGVSLYSGTKSSDAPIDGSSSKRKWQWKFLVAPIDPSSELYESPDPYAIQLFNRQANYSATMDEPNPMRIPIKVNGKDRFTLLSHPDGGYALAVNGLGTYSYDFLNGASMTVPSTTAATTATEAAFTNKTGTISTDAQLLVNDDVTHEYTYYVINNALNQAVSGTQSNAEATENSFAPTLPYNIQSPLLNMDDYLYYGSATKDDKENVDPSDDTYEVVDLTKLFTLYGLYDDKVYVRYKAYDENTTEYAVPNKRNATGGGTIAVADDSEDAPLNIKGELPYNIIWEGDHMMKAIDTTEPADEIDDQIADGGSKVLEGGKEYVWRFYGDDPYAIIIRNGNDGRYVDGTGTLSESATKTFMLLKHADCEYGVLQVTGDASGNKLTDYGETLTTNATPKYFIIFGLSTHKLIYHLVIAATGDNVSIPYRDGNETTYQGGGTWTESDKIVIPGTTQRNLTDATMGVAGDRYQLGTTILGQTYCYDAGEVSIGDVLKVPSVFNRPNCNFFFYVDDIQTGGTTGTHQKTVASEDAMNTDVSSLAAVGNYYYKITGQYIYRKVHVTEVNDGAKDAAYEISVCTADEYDAAASKAEVATESAMITSANAKTAIGDYFYKIGTIDLYKRVQVTAVSPVANTVVDCTLDDWTNVWQDNVTLNNKYKGLKITKLMSDPGLIGSVVKVNVAYAFQTGLETNAGEGFVTSTDQNLWYTFETHDVATPCLAHYTNAWGLKSMEGRATRYTNDYLWTPLGDVYGFKLYNRYMLKNSGGVNNVMTFAGDVADDKNLLLAVPGGDYTEGNEVFELLGSNEPGYFRIHPVINHTGTQYYIKKDPSDDYAKLSTGYSEWTFGLDAILLAPYVERVGYVGGLKQTAYSTNKALLDRVKNGTATYEDLITTQGIVYNDENIVSYQPGYYRLHNQPGVSSISPVRYASGYLHETEKTAVSGGIPMHFYSKSGVTTKYAGEGSLESGYTISNATRGDIPIVPTEQDPSTLFYFDGNTISGGNPRSTIQTQGLYVAANPNGDTNNGTTTNRLQRAVMKAIAPENVETQAITFSLMDIGGAVLLIHDGVAPATRRYLNYDQSNFFQRTATDDTDYNSKKVALTSIGDYYFKIGSSTYKVVKVTGLDPYAYSEESSNGTDWTKAADIYDLKYYHDAPTDNAKWCMQPVQKGNSAGAGEMALTITTNKGGDDYYYTTFYAPFDVLLPADAASKTYYAYTCDKWDDKNLHPKYVPEVTGTPAYAKGKFVPAGTPVIIRTTDESGSMKLTLPNDVPSTKLDCCFSGTYLEKLLDVDAAHDVYTLGLPFKTTVSKDDDYDETGDINAPLPEQDNSGVGFYINATPNKELDPSQSLWFRNNRYVLHNKIYYRATADPGARELDMEAPQFVPIIFGDEEGGEEQELMPDGSRQAIIGDGCIYDLSGRKVATEQQVQDGSWRTTLASGIYILNGRKFQKK